MKYSQRHVELNALFQLGKETCLEPSGIDVKFESFNTAQLGYQLPLVCASDNFVKENQSFIYPVFMPRGMKKCNRAIVLLHGLNERSWSKYLTWAEYLCKQTGKAIILFPLAFHINRSPDSWSNPRELAGLLDLRRNRFGVNRSLSFANAAFSHRVSEDPLRFYNSGKQSLNDLEQLFATIKSGRHRLFTKDTQIDILAYSIGAFLAEIALIHNPSGLFTDSYLFLFCGGGIFSSMRGESRFIMDKPAYECLYDYYLNRFCVENSTAFDDCKMKQAFNSMISPERNRIERERFFSNRGTSLTGISLAQDTVIPYQGVVEALGVYCATSQIELMDFSFNYSHENPFPVGSKFDDRAVDNAFLSVFDKIAEFFQ